MKSTSKKAIEMALKQKILQKLNRNIEICKAAYILARGRRKIAEYENILLGYLHAEKIIKKA